MSPRRRPRSPEELKALRARLADRLSEGDPMCRICEFKRVHPMPSKCKIRGNPEIAPFGHVLDPLSCVGVRCNHGLEAASRALSKAKRGEIKWQRIKTDIGEVEAVPCPTHLAGPPASNKSHVVSPVPKTGYVDRNGRLFVETEAKGLIFNHQTLPDDRNPFKKKD